MISNAQMNQFATLASSAIDEPVPVSTCDTPGSADGIEEPLQVRLRHPAELGDMGAGEPLDACSEVLDAGRMVVEVLVVGTVAEQLAHEEAEDRVIGAGSALEVSRRQAGRLGAAGIDDP